MKLTFAGTPEFAAVSLQALLRARHEITLVLTQPDRPAGRGLKPQPSAVKRLALEHRLPLLQPATLREGPAPQAIAAARPEAMVVAAYGLMVPAALLQVPARGCINVHASLLPRWRGAAPIQRALLAGDRETGVTIMQMDEGLDTGPILLQRAIPITAEDTGGTLHDRLATLGAELLVAALDGNPPPRAQDPALACYAPRLGKGDPDIDWRRPAAEIERQVRALAPAPGARARLGDLVVKIWRARVEPATGAQPATVTAAGNDGIVIACGRDALRIIELQRAGGRRLPVREFMAGHAIAPGARFGRVHD